MKQQLINRELEEAARKLGLEVRTEKGSFRGGRCTVVGQNMVVLNRRHPPEAHFAVLAEALRDLPLETVFLTPAARQALEKAWERQASAAATDDAPEALE